MTIPIADHILRHAAETGGPAGFLNAVTVAVQSVAGDEITAETLRDFTADQVTLLAFHILRREVTQGGFIQLIHNGYGEFFFHNPFAKAMRLWGVDPLAKIINAGRKLYERYAEQLTAEMDDDEFMALYEAFPAFDRLDDDFIEDEDKYVEAAAAYVDAHLSQFVEVEAAE